MTGAAAPPQVSVVIPVLDGASMVPTAHRRIAAALRRAGLTHEVIFVDDGSTDGTWDVVRGLVADGGAVRGIRLGGNVGQALATAAGLARARGAWVVTTDVDLETSPDELADLLAPLEAGRADLVSGRRSTSRRWTREVPSRLFNSYARTAGIAVHDVGCGTNAMTADVAGRYVAEEGIRRSLPTPILVRLADRAVEVPLTSRRPETSRIGPGDLARLWLDFDERQRRHPDALVAAVGITLVAAGWRPDRRARAALGWVGLAAALGYRVARRHLRSAVVGPVRVVEVCPSDGR